MSTMVDHSFKENEIRLDSSTSFLFEEDNFLFEETEDENKEETYFSDQPEIPLLCNLFTRQSHSKLGGFIELMRNMNNLEFFKLSRVTKETFTMICDMLSTHEAFKHQTNHGGKEPISAEVSLMTTLWYLGKQCSYIEIKEQFGISQSATHVQVSKVINVINEVYKDIIKWPSPNDAPKVEEEFRNLSNFPGVIAAIDGCHIKIKAPADHQNDYLDRTRTHTINLLAACDANKKFLYVYAGFPGSAHDQRVFSLSPLGIRLEQNYKSLCYSDQYHIIGDSAFALKSYIMVPYRDTGNLDNKMINFNTKLSKTRRVIENAFGWLKGRFRRLKDIDADLEKITNIVTAACILHNITVNFDEERRLLECNMDAEPVAESSTRNPDCNVPDSTIGINKRDRIMQSL